MPEGKIWETIEQQKKTIEQAKATEKQLRALLLECNMFLRSVDLDDVAMEISERMVKIPMIEDFE